MAWIISIVITIIIMFLIANPLILIIVLGGFTIMYFLYEFYKNSDTGRRTKILNNRKKIIKAKELQEKLNSLGVFPTHIISHQTETLYFDENNKKLYLELLYDNYLINFDDILNYEIITNSGSNIQYTMKTAIMGTLEQKQAMRNIFVYIYLNDIDTPYIKILCLGDGSIHNADSMAVYEANEFANKIIRTLDYIKNNKQKNKKQVLDLIPKLETEFISKKDAIICDKCNREFNKNKYKKTCPYCGCSVEKELNKKVEISKKVLKIQDENKIINEGIYQGYTIKEKKQEMKKIPIYILFFSIFTIFFQIIVGWSKTFSLIFILFFSIFVSGCLIIVIFSIKHLIKSIKYTTKMSKKEAEKDFKI